MRTYVHHKIKEKKTWDSEMRKSGRGTRKRIQEERHQDSKREKKNREKRVKEALNEEK